MSWQQIIVQDQERVLVSKNGRFDRILLPGEYCIRVASFTSLDTEKHRVRDVIFRSAWADYLIDHQPETTRRHFTLVQTTDQQVGMVYVDGALLTVLVPSKRQLFWRAQACVSAEIVNVLGDPEPPVTLLECAVLTGTQSH